MSTYSKIGDDTAKAIIGIPANALGTANNLVVATKKLTQGFSNESEGIGEAVGKTVATTGKLTETAVKTTNEGVQIIGQTLNLGNEAIGGLSDYAQDKRKEKNLQRKIKQKAREDTQLEKLELNKLEMKLEYDKQKLIAEKRVMYDHNVDQRGYKWSGKSILKNLDIKLLPEHIASNLEKYSDWLD